MSDNTENEAETNQETVKRETVKETVSDEVLIEGKGKVGEPSIDDNDLTWLDNGKFALYKKRPLSNTLLTVFYGRQRVLSGHWREVAIKVIQYENTLDELGVLMKLQHPNIVQIIDAGELNEIDYMYIVMELCHQNLRNYVETNSFNFQKSFSFIQQIVEGLAYLHNNNVTHRDFKPDNILISHCKNNIKLSDFGLSIEIPVGQSAATVTAIGVGTDGYRAPETYQNIYQVSPSIDIFPFGLVTYFIFTSGKHPFGSNPYEWPLNIIENKNCDLSEIPLFDEPNAHKREHLKDLLRQTLQHNPSMRPTIKDIQNSAFLTGKTSSTTALYAQTQSSSPASGSQWVPVDLPNMIERPPKSKRLFTSFRNLFKMRSKKHLKGQSSSTASFTDLYPSLPPAVGSSQWQSAEELQNTFESPHIDEDGRVVYYY